MNSVSTAQSFRTASSPINKFEPSRIPASLNLEFVSSVLLLTTAMSAESGGAAEGSAGYGLNINLADASLTLWIIQHPAFELTRGDSIDISRIPWKVVIEV